MVVYIFDTIILHTYSYLNLISRSSLVVVIPFFYNLVQIQDLLSLIQVLRLAKKLCPGQIIILLNIRDSGFQGF